MQDILRESWFGQALNAASHGRLFPYAEEKPGFVIPERYLQSSSSSSPSRRVTPPSSNSTRAPSINGFEVARTDSDNATLADRDAARVMERLEASEKQKKNVEKSAEKTHNLEEGKDKNLVEWYGEDDPDNPQNWGTGRKALLMGSMMLLTFSMYVGSAIYTPSIPGVMTAFNVSQTKAILGLSLYVIFYGIGPMILSPLSEIPSFGRLNVYMVTGLLFMLIQIPTALAPNYSTLMAMRALAGFLCSPALSTGGATLSDVFSPMTVPYVMAGWAAGAVAGPVFGPVAAGFAAQEENWRWPLYMLLFISVFNFFFLFFFFPETSSATILLRRAQRLRKLTGNKQLRSASEIEQAQMSPTEIASTSLLRPFLLFRDPAVLFIDIYIALVYAIFYLWFEAFPITWAQYGFNLGLSNLPFLGFIIALVPTMLCYFAYQKYRMIPSFQNGTAVPEDRLEIAFIGATLIPAALFIFGWTAQEHTHWMGPIIGASLYLPGIYLVFQGCIVYLPLSYGQYAASVLAGNALLRGVLGGVFPLFGHAFFDTLDLGPGSSLLAGLSIVMIIPMYFLWKYGAKLRAKSKYATA